MTDTKTLVITDICFDDDPVNCECFGASLTEYTQIRITAENINSYDPRTTFTFRSNISDNWRVGQKIKITMTVEVED